MLFRSFLRPNYALAVAILGTIFIYISLQKPNRQFPIAIGALAGLALGLCMPLHNIFYGREFYLISEAGATVSVTLSPLTYLKATGELLTGNWQGSQLTLAVEQIKGWLWTPPVTQFPLHAGLGLLLFLRLLTLLITIMALFIPDRRIPHIAMLAWIALAAHLPMLFVFETKLRYDLLGWDLSAIVTIMLAVHVLRHHPFSLSWKVITPAANP